MPLIIAVWPNNTLSILRMSIGFTMLDLYEQLDWENDPLCATCYRAKEDEDGLHVTFDWSDVDPGTQVGPDTEHIELGTVLGCLKKLKWPPGIRKQWWRERGRDIRRQEADEMFRYLTEDENPRLPAPPPPSHTADAVRAMEPFCGVYLAYDPDGSCYYVGESAKVPERVTSSRPEIGERLIGLVRCDMSQRKRIESYYIGLLNPPGNAQSSHRMSRKEATDGTHTQS